jgi:hypothetical protein
MALDPVTVFAVKNVTLNPDANGLPGSKVLQSLVDGLAFWALIASLAALVAGAALWAWAAHAQNHQYSANGRRAAGVAALAALLIGAAPALINFFADAGDKVK